MQAPQSIDSWGNGYLIMVENHSTNPSTLIFPDDASSKRDLAPGEIIGKPPLGNVGAAQQMLPIVTDRNSIRSDKYPTIKNTKISRKPSISGIGTTLLTAFNQDQTVILTPFFGKGGLWLTSDNFEIPSSISFSIYGEDKTAIALLLSNSEKNAKIKIKISSINGDFIYIIKDDVEISKIDLSLIPDAKLAAGRFKSFWVSFDEHEKIFIGFGDNIGENILLIEQVPGLSQNCNRIGFQSFEQQVGLSQVKISPPPIFFFNTVLTPAEVKDLSTTPPSENNFTVFLQNTQDQSITFIDNSNNSLTCNIQKNAINILEKGETSKNKTISIDENAGVYLFFNFHSKNLTIGYSNDKLEVIKFLKIININQIKNLNQINLSSSEIKIFFGSVMQSQINFLKGIGENNKKISFTGNLTVQRPYFYQFDQQGPAIICYDKINNNSYILGEAPQQGAYYSFKATINPSGSLDLKWYLDPTNPKKMGMKAAVGAIRFIESSLFTVADQSANEDTPEIGAQLSQTAATAALVSAGAAARMAAGLIEGEIETFRDEKNVLKTETMKNQSSMTGSIPDTAIINRKKVEQKVNELKKITITSRNNFDHLQGELTAMIDLINHPYIAPINIKQSVLTFLKQLISFKNQFIKKKTDKNMFNEKIGVETSNIDKNILLTLINICNNENLMTANSITEKYITNNFSQNLNNFASMLIDNNQMEKEIPIPNTSKLFLQSNKKLTQPCSFIFEQRGAGKLSLIFISANNPTITKNLLLQKNDLALEIILGERQSNNFALKKNFLGPIFKEKNFLQDDPQSLSLLEFKRFWVNFDDKRIQFGQGVLGENIIFDEPNPILDNIMAFGFSSGASNEIKNIAHGPSIKTISTDLQNYIKELNQPSSSWSLTKINNQGGIILNGSGTIIFNTKLNNGDSFDVFFTNTTKNINYKLNFTQQSNLTIDLINVSDNNKSIKSVILNKQLNEFSTWIEIDKQILSFGQGSFSDSPINFISMLPGISGISLEFKFEKKNGDPSITKPFLLNAKRNIDFAFLYQISNGKLKIPKNKADIDKEKDLALNEAITSSINDFAKNDPLMNSLTKDDKKIFTDFIKLALNEDDFDNYLATSMENTAWNESFGEDFISSDTTLNDTLDSEAKESLQSYAKLNVINQHSERGSVQRQMMQGLSGVGMQITQEAQDFKNVSGLFKKNKGSTAEEIANNDGTRIGFGIVKDVRDLKRAEKSLFGGKNDFETQKTANLSDKKEYDWQGNETGKKLYQLTTSADGQPRKIYSNIILETKAQIDDYIKRQQAKKYAEKQKQEADSKKILEKKDALSKTSDSTNAFLSPKKVQDFIMNVARYMKGSRVSESKSTKITQKSSSLDEQNSNTQSSSKTQDKTAPTNEKKTSIITKDRIKKGAIISLEVVGSAIGNMLAPDAPPIIQDQSTQEDNTTASENPPVNDLGRVESALIKALN